MKKRFMTLILCIAFCSPVSADWKMPTKKATPEKDALRNEIATTHPDNDWSKLSQKELDGLILQMLIDNGYLPAPTPTPTPTPKGQAK